MNVREEPTVVLEMTSGEAGLLLQVAEHVVGTWADEDGNPAAFHFAGKLHTLLLDYR